MSGWEGLLQQYLPQIQAGAKNVGNGLLDFAKTPEAWGLAQGLLSEATPSMTTPRSFAGGLARGIEGMSEATKKKAERDLIKAQILKMDQDAAQKKAQQEFLKDYLGGGTPSAKPPGSPEETADEANRRKRAGILAGAGFTEEAFKVLTEKPDKLSGEKATTATLSKAQNVIQGANYMIPQLEELKKQKAPIQVPWYLGGHTATQLLSGNAQAAYEGVTSGLVEAYINAMGLSATDKNAKLAEKEIQRQPNESEKSYHKRIDHLIKRLEAKRAQATKLTSIGTTDARPAYDYSDAELEDIANE